MDKTYFAIALILALTMLQPLGSTQAISKSNTYNYQKTGIIVEFDKTKYEQFTTNDRFGRLITFYVSGPDNKKVPLVVFLNGSGFGSVFYKKNNNVQPQYRYHDIVKAINGRARLVLVEKPGVKLFDTPKKWGTCTGAPDQFLKEQTVERYTEAVNAAIRAGESLPGVDTSRLLVMGHSEGAEMSAHIARNNNNVTHVACLAGVGTSQLFDFVTMVSNGIMNCPGETPTDKIEYVYRKWSDIQADPESITKFYAGHPYRRWYSFWSQPALESLLRTNANIYIAKGTNDKNSSIVSFDVTRSELLAHGKNIVCERIQNADHSFKIKHGDTISDELPELLKRVTNWYLK